MTSKHNTIDHVSLSRLVEANAVNGANIIGEPGGWGVVIKYGETERALAAQRGSVRIFRKFETLVSYLKDMGVMKYQVDATGFDPVTLKLSRRNDGAHNRMKATHEAAAYDKFYRVGVKASLDDPRPSITHKEMKARTKAIIDAAARKQGVAHGN
jgi:hypothetical protein